MKIKNAELWLTVLIRSVPKKNFSAFYFSLKRVFTLSIVAVVLVFFSSFKGLAQSVSLSSANASENGITSNSLTLGQKNIVLFGFGVGVQGVMNINEFNIEISSPDNKNNYFSNYKLYRSSDNIFSGDDVEINNTATFKKNNLNNLNIEGLSESFNSSVKQIRFYFLLADYTNDAGVVPGSIQFRFNSKQKNDAVVAGKKAYNNFNVNGPAFNITGPEISLSSANASTNGITPASITLGDKSVVLFGFGLKVKGVSTVNQINIGCNTIIGNYFSNVRLFRSQDNIYSPDDILVSSGNSNKNAYNNIIGNYLSNSNLLRFEENDYSSCNALNSLINIIKNKGSVFSISNLVEAFNWSPERYYFLVADYTIDGPSDNQSIQFKFSVNQPFSALEQSVPERKSYNNFEIAGQIFRIVRTANWLGNAPGDANNWNNPLNWTGRFVPGSNDVAYLGSKAFINPPVVSADASVGKIIFGAVQPLSLAVDSGATLTTNDIIQTSADASIINTLTGKGNLVTNSLEVGDINGKVSYSSGRATKLVSQISNLTINNVIIRSKYLVYSNDAAFEIAGGTVNINGFIQTINENVSNTSSLLAGEGSNLALINSNPFHLSSVGNNNLNSEGLISYNGSEAQTVETSVSYSDLHLSGSGVKTIEAASSGPFYLKGSLSITSPASIAFSPNFDAINIRGNFQGNSSLKSRDLPIYIGGNWTNTSKDTVGSEVYYDGNADQIIGGLKYHNLYLSNGGTKSLRDLATVNGNIEVAANTVLNTGDKLILSADSLSNANIKPLLNGADILGKVTVQSFIKGGKRGYLSLSSPVYDTTSTSQAVKAFTFSQLKRYMPLTGNGGPVNGFDEGAVLNPFGPTIRLYRESASPSQSPYFYPSKVADTISSGKGFFYFYRGNRSSIFNKVNPPFITPESTLIEYTGFVNKGNISVPVNFTNYFNEGDDGFNVVGNPYPSTIDLHKLLSGTPYTKVWIPTFNNTYAIYDLALGTGTNGASRYIIPGQAFFIQAKAPGVLTFTEDCKVTSVVSAARIMSGPSVSVGFTALTSNKSKTSQYIKVRATNLNDGFSDETMIVFNNGSNSNGTVEDAANLSDAKTLLSSISIDGIPLAINYLPKTEKDNEVKLLIKGEESGLYSIKITENIVSDFLDIFLQDNYLNTSTSLKSGEYYFSVDKDNKATYGGNRFLLIFKREGSNASAEKSLTSTAKVSVNQQKMLIFPNPVSTDLQVNLNRENLPVELRIYNISGKLVKKNVWNTAGTIVQSVSDLHIGAYMIELRETTGNTVLGRSKFINLSSINN